MKTILPNCASYVNMQIYSKPIESWFLLRSWCYRHERWPLILDLTPAHPSSSWKQVYNKQPSDKKENKSCNKALFRRLSWNQTLTLGDRWGLNFIDKTRKSILDSIFKIIHYSICILKWCYRGVEGVVVFIVKQNVQQTEMNTYF